MNWKSVQGYEEYYEVSDQGQVRSIDRYITQTDRFGNTYQRKIKGRILKQIDNGEGYMVVSLSVENKSVLARVHRMVAKAFIENPCGKETVNHKDMDKTNNTVLNLEWMTSSENTRHYWVSKQKG